MKHFASHQLAYVWAGFRSDAQPELISGHSQPNPLVVLLPQVGNWGWAVTAKRGFEVWWHHECYQCNMRVYPHS